MRHLRSLARVVCLLTAGVAAGAQGAPAAMAAAPPHKRVAVALVGRRGSATLQLRLADTPAAHARGLMYQKKLDDDDGMLFVFARAERRAFWMKNTLVALDMIFVGADCRIVGIVENAAPHDLRDHAVAGASQYVVELRGGSAARLSLAPGDAVFFASAGHRCSPS